MSTSWHFMKDCALHIKSIEEKTIIRKVTSETGVIGLVLEENYVWTSIDHDDEPIRGVISYAGNDPTEIFRILVKTFDLYFVSEHVIREYLEDQEPIPDKVIDQYRKSLLEGFSNKPRKIESTNSETDNIDIQ